MRPVIPDEKPILKGLQSYYLNLPKFIEHHRNEVPACAIHWKSAAGEGVLYLDSGECIGAFCRSGATTLQDEPAVASLLDAATRQNFQISVYEIDPALVHLWANSINARLLHRDLTSDITDLDRLIAKMAKERLNGFIEAATHDGAISGILFFHAGDIVHGALNSSAGPQSIQAVRERLNEAIKAQGGTFQVSTIPDREERRPIAVDGFTGAQGKKRAAATLPRQAGKSDPSLIPALEDLLHLVESLCREQRKSADFGALWRKAALQAADRYGFLDPFAKEFHYAEGKIRLELPVEDRLLAAGVLECVQAIIGSVGLTGRFKEKAAAWFAEHAALLDDLGIREAAGGPVSKP